MRPMKKAIRFIIVVSFSAIVIVSDGATNLKAETLDKVQELLPLAEEGDRDALDEMFKILEKLKIEQPDDPRVLAYLGGAYGLSAAQVWNPITKGEQGELSIRNLDVALEMAPDDIEVRYIRARVNLEFPYFLGRRNDAIEDLIALDRLFRENPDPDKAEDMQRFYDILIKEAPDRGDWEDGKKLAARHAN